MTYVKKFCDWSLNEAKSVLDKSDDLQFRAARLIFPSVKQQYANVKVKIYDYQKPIYTRIDFDLEKMPVGPGMYDCFHKSLIQQDWEPIVSEWKKVFNTNNFDGKVFLVHEYISMWDTKNEKFSWNDDYQKLVNLTNGRVPFMLTDDFMVHDGGGHNNTLFVYVDSVLSNIASNIPRRCLIIHGVYDEDLRGKTHIFDKNKSLSVQSLAKKILSQIDFEKDFDIDRHTVIKALSALYFIVKFDSNQDASFRKMVDESKTLDKKGETERNTKKRSDEIKLRSLIKIHSGPIKNEQVSVEVKNDVPGNFWVFYEDGEGFGQYCCGGKIYANSARDALVKLLLSNSMHMGHYTAEKVYSIITGDKVDTEDEDFDELSCGPGGSDHAYVQDSPIDYYGILGTKDDKDRERISKLDLPDTDEYIKCGLLLMGVPYSVIDKATNEYLEGKTDISQLLHKYRGAILTKKLGL